MDRQGQPLEHSGLGEGQSVVGLKEHGAGEGHTEISISRKEFDPSEIVSEIIHNIRIFLGSCLGNRQGLYQYSDFSQTGLFLQ